MASYNESKRVDNAIILAAGFGSRCVPLTYETPKGLLTVYGKPMIERQIEQLLEKEITEIIIVVGYLKEKFDYLIDKYGVKLIYNPEYSTKNNLASLHCVLPYLKNSYILCADNWIENNIFNTFESDSWFSCIYMDGHTDEWSVKEGENERIDAIDIGSLDAWCIIGPAFFLDAFSEKFAKLTDEYYNKAGTADYYWEHILRENIQQLPIYMNKQVENVFEFESLAELRKYDKSYLNESNNKIMGYISKILNVEESKIENIYPLKAGVTNTSFHFSIGKIEYVFRLPGVGTDKQINRKNEKNVYDKIKPLGVSDQVVSFDAESGIKISLFYADTHIANPFDDNELKISMEQVVKIHQSGINSEELYDIEKRIKHYLSLADDLDAVRFSDINETRKKVNDLLLLREKLNIKDVLCHGDYANTNVLILSDGSGKIIDWEYSGMADPIMDIAMYTIFSEFNKERIDLALRLYLKRSPTYDEQNRMYLYVALGGFLWCVWAEYKQALGQEFGEYPLIMYRYMKDYYKLLQANNAFDEIIR